MADFELNTTNLLLLATLAVTVYGGLNGWFNFNVNVNFPWLPSESGGAYPYPTNPPYYVASATPTLTPTPTPAPTYGGGGENYFGYASCEAARVGLGKDFYAVNPPYTSSLDACEAYAQSYCQQFGSPPWWVQILDYAPIDCCVWSCSGHF